MCCVVLRLGAVTVRTFAGLQVRMSSFQVSASQARLFGFSPKYVWDEFSVEHTSIARKIRTETISKFLEMADLEADIKGIAAGVLKGEGVNPDVYRLQVAARREASKVEARVALHGLQMMERRAAVVPSVASSEAIVCEDESTLGDVCEKCAKMEVEMEALRSELRTCHEERNKWRGRFMEVERKYQALLESEERKRRKVIDEGQKVADEELESIGEESEWGSDEEP